MKMKWIPAFYAGLVRGLGAGNLAASPLVFLEAVLVENTGNVARAYDPQRTGASHK
jgi:hypothetical protein